MKNLFILTLLTILYLMGIIYIAFWLTTIFINNV